MNKDSIPESKKQFVEMPYKEKPDRVNSDNISLFDLHDDMQFVDTIPVDELNKKVGDEGDELLEEVLYKEKKTGGKMLDSETFEHKPS